MTNSDILKIAMQQSAIDNSCYVEDFCTNENKIVISRTNADARKYLKLPFFCDLVSYGNNIVASVDKTIVDLVGDYINKYPVEHCFETPNMQILNDMLYKHNMRICFMAEYFLPDINILKPLDCKFKIEVLSPEQFAGLYLPEWGNALCEKRKSLDVLAVAAYDNEKLIGLAGCSADCDTMWQIGIDVLPTYQKRGIASAITSRLAIEALNCGIVPFYCCAWSNIKSVRNAIKSGFRPAFIEMTAKNLEFISEMNK